MVLAYSNYNIAHRETEKTAHFQMKYTFHAIIIFQDDFLKGGGRLIFQAWHASSRKNEQYCVGRVEHFFNETRRLIQEISLRKGKNSKRRGFRSALADLPANSRKGILRFRLIISR